MNTTRLFRMAPYALMLLAGPLFFSCSHEIDPWGTEDDSELMTISVSQPGTRTSNDGNSTLWSEGDAISVIHSTTGGNTFWSSWFGFYGGNMFQGSVNRLSSSNDWYAVYPYVEENIAANEINLTFPSRQVQTGNSNKSHFSGEQFPMFGKKTEVARADELSLSMKNLLSAAEFKVTNTEDYPIVVKEVELTGPSYIAGGFKVDLTSDEPVLTAKSGSKTVRLAVTDGEEIAPGENARFYLAVAPFDIPAGGSFKIKVVAENASNPGTNIVYYHTFELASGASFTSGLIKTINVSFDDDSSQNPDAGSAGEVELEVGEQPEDGVYLLVYENGANSMAFAPFADQKANNYAIQVNVVDGVVIPEDGQNLSTYAVTIEVAKDDNGNPITHSNDADHYAYNVRNSAGQYVFYSTSGGTLDASEALQIKDTNEMDIDGSTYKYYHTFVQAADGVQILSSIYGASGGNKYLLAYTAANGFYYEENNTGQKLHLYRLGGTVKEKQYPAFSAERVEYDFDASGPGVLANAPTLADAMTSVTYSSSDESVASVDADGNVTIHKAGTATITATAAADDVYYSATAQYLIVSTTSAGTTFYRVTEFTAGEQYLIVSAGKALANNNGSIAATDVSASGDEVIVSDAASMMWTATASGSGFTLANNGYYVQRASGSGGGKPSISNSPNTSYYVWNYSNNRLSTSGSNSTYYLYYSSGWVQTNSSSSAGTVSIYSLTKPLTKQTLSFAQSSVAWVIGEGYDLNGSYAFPQTVTGNVTPVTYTSSNTSVATISGDRITIVATGWTTIKARTEGNDEYAPAEASYTLRIREQVSGDFVDLGVFNLENEDVYKYLNAAETQYTDDNYKGIGNTNGVSIVSTYTDGASNTNRKDIPKPVTIDWGKSSSGTTTITIFSDPDLAETVWTQSTTTSKTSDVVYNLIPGETYYCTVEDQTGLLLQGTFTTEGRRRMIRLSDSEGAFDRANNFRDLGGLVTADGKKRIKYGWIFRGTNLDSTTAEERAIMLNYLNIGYDIDLRQSNEGKRVFDLTDANYLMADYGANLSDLRTTSKVKATLLAFFNAAKAGKASYFHCRIGSDRTGYWGLLIEGMLGISAKDCSIDFELTGFAKNVTSGDRPRNATNYLFYQGMEGSSSSSWGGGSSQPGFMQEENGVPKFEGSTLQEKITNYLVNQVGIDRADIEEFKSLVLEDI